MRFVYPKRLLAKYLSQTLGYYFLFLGIISFAMPSQAAQPSLTPPSYSDVLRKNSSHGLDALFWKRFDIFSTKETAWKREKANDFASKVGFSLPSLAFSGDYPLLVFQVMPDLKIGIGQQAVLFLNQVDFHPTGNVPIRLWFDNGDSIGFSKVKWINHPVFALLSDDSESVKLSQIIQMGAVPVLISQGRAALRLRYNETLDGNKTLLWYQKICSPTKNTALQKHLLAKAKAFQKKQQKEAKS